MKSRTRRVLAVLLAFPVAILGLGVAVRGGSWLASIMHESIPDGEPGTNLLPNLHVDLYFNLSFFVLAFALGISTVFILWDRRPSSRTQTGVFILLLLVILPISAINFMYGDYLMRRSVQVILDFILVFLGSITTLGLLKLEPRSSVAKVLQVMVLFILVLEAILLPLIYAVLWLLNWQGAFSKTNANSLSPAWISAAASIISAVIAILTFRRTKIVDEKSSIVRP